jgi:hypothetical protein
VCINILTSKWGGTVEVGPWPEVCGLTYYHVMARGNRREDIFLDDNDRAGIEGAGLDRQDLKALPGSDARKVALAKFLREPSTVSLEWVARALCMEGRRTRGTTCERGGGKV